uniref:non-specific serine/threonine protein kinase n=1 Tax=Panagrolaimus davidi TaxID=227884 RepID=A0A914PKF1_9BILA
MEQNQRSSSTFSPLRTYSVIPLSPKCGIIEWCEGTVSLCSYLVGDKKDGGAHAQYRPKDILASKGQQIMKSRQNGYNSTEVFLDICKSIQPVFRHFFYSKFNNSKDFHEAIDRYTQSLAQWSIVCYVVGLGDRHLNNILIDEKRGELVHIDLGQIFEFSKRSLPIPERIPFRLTRDLVDPLLIDGVYGHLKDIAVHTMKQMRENARVIVGIASSLVHDPVSTFAAVSSQTNNRHFVAEAAISRLKEKLAGRDSSLFVLTPEQQVCNLIQDATNPENLSKVFVGWMPFI